MDGFKIKPPKFEVYWQRTRARARALFSSYGDRHKKILNSHWTTPYYIRCYSTCGRCFQSHIRYFMINLSGNDEDCRLGEIETARGSIGEYHVGHVMEQYIRLRTTRWNKAQRYGQCSGKANRGKLPSLRLGTARNATGSPCRIVRRRCGST